MINRMSLEREITDLLDSEGRRRRQAPGAVRERTAEAMSADLFGLRAAVLRLAQELDRHDASDSAE